MELSWSTFLLEVINFLVLLAILKYFLYRPVLALIEQRRQRIEDSMAQAAVIKTEAETLHAQYENRLAEWEQEKKQAAAALEQQLARLRQQRMDEQDTELLQQRAKAEAIASKGREELQRQLEHRAMTQAASFASRLLTDFSDDGLQARVIARLLADLARFDESRLNELRQAWCDATETNTVVTAFPLDTAAQTSLLGDLARVLGDTGKPCSFSADLSLIAGVRIAIGPWLLRANLKDELEGFADSGNHLQ